MLLRLTHSIFRPPPGTSTTRFWIFPAGRQLRLAGEDGSRREKLQSGHSSAVLAFWTRVGRSSVELLLRGRAGRSQERWLTRSAGLRIYGNPVGDVSHASDFRSAVRWGLPA
jgi:hypothetical protein